MNIGGWFGFSSNGAAQEERVKKPDLFGAIAFLEIAIHPWTQEGAVSDGLGTKYRVSKGKLIPMASQEYQLGPVNCQGFARTVYNLTGGSASQNSLLKIGKQLKKFINWYCYSVDEEFKAESKAFLIKYLKPGLTSIKEVYKGTPMEGQIELWIVQINLLSRSILEPKQKQISEYNRRVKDLLTKEHLKKINEIFKIAYEDTYSKKNAIGQIREEIEVLHSQYLIIRKAKDALQKSQS